MKILSSSFSSSFFASSSSTSSSSSSSFSSSSFAAVFVLRVINAFALQTFYVPDEYWQSLEVAHRLVFGYGHLTWEWEKRIRGYFHPSLFVPAYSLLKFLRLDSTAWVVAAPKVVQAFFAAVGDVYFYRFAVRAVGPEAAKWASFAYATNHFALFSLPRTLSNSLETILSVAALSYFPWSRRRRRRKAEVKNEEEEEEEEEEKEKIHKNEEEEEEEEKIHVYLAALTVVVRPTALVTWIPLWLPRLLSSSSSSSSSSPPKIILPVEKRRKKRFFLLLTKSASIAVFASVALDSYCYGRPTFVPLEFLTFNVFRGVASFYGSHPFHWYFTQGFWCLLGPHSVPFVLEIWRRMTTSWRKKGRFAGMTMVMPGGGGGGRVQGRALEEEEGPLERRESTCLKMILWILVVYSFLGHKEFRFIFTALPLAMCFVGKYFASLDRDASSFGTWKKKLIVGSVTVLNVCGFLYLATYHQRGNLDAVRHLADRLDALPPRKLDDVRVLFLLPCHQHPYYSHLHRDVEMRFLRCEPPLYNDHDDDEADRFFADPRSWFLLEILGGGAAEETAASSSKPPPPPPRPPTHVVVSSEIGERLAPLFADGGLRKTRSFFHSHLEMDARMGTSLDFWEREGFDDGGGGDGRS